VVSSEFDFQGFTWAPDGSGLIVSSARGSSMPYPPTFNLWFLPWGSGASRQLTFGESSYESPDVSSSGAILASRLRANSDIWKFPTTGEPR
jgi:Tol biopolymer transport system component